MTKFRDLTDDELAKYVGIDKKYDALLRRAFFKTLTPAKRATLNRLAHLELELALWEKGLGPKPRAIVLARARR